MKGKRQEVLAGKKSFFINIFHRKTFSMEKCPSPFEIFLGFN